MIFLEMIVGIISGVICGLFASGGGLIVVPSLMYIFKQDAVKARATSVFAILPMVIASGIFYYTNNYIDWSIGIKCGIGGVIRWVLGCKATKENI